MQKNNKKPDLQAVLAGLKDFQEETVDYVFKRMYEDSDFTRRFLIADEVGLGKTIIAKGIIAKAIDHLWENTKRIDIVYICSNSDIARQNVNRLNILKEDQFALASRITLLPLQISNLNSNRINFVSFTPGTSFEMHSSMGVAKERALIFKLLENTWELKGTRPLNIFCGRMKREHFIWCINEITNTRIDEKISERFVSKLEDSIQRERFNRLLAYYTRENADVPYDISLDRIKLISELRNVLAQICLDAIEPDLIILDEFQRFRNLLTGQDEAATLARDLFEYSSGKDQARVLLLSATPYKMYTMNHETEDEDHYKSFIDTAKFLFKDEPDYIPLLKDRLEQYRRELVHIDTKNEYRLGELSKEIESILSRVMVRSERLAVTQNRDGMLVDIRSSENKVQPEDIKSYLALERLAEKLSVSYSPLELWKSAPYLLNFMEAYELKRAFEEKRGDAEMKSKLCEAIAEAQSLLLPWEDIQAYNKLDPQNARLRSLLHETLDQDMWKLAWMPASLPYYRPEGVFQDSRLNKATKKLVFSSWQVVPKVVSTLLTYEAERRMFLSFDKNAKNREEVRKKRKPLLRFAKSTGRLTGMPILGMIYPSIFLASHFDPLKMYLETEPLPSLSHLIDHFETIAMEYLSKLKIPISREGSEDERWYWAAPLLLDHHFYPNETEEWLRRENLAGIWSGKDMEEDPYDAMDVEEQPAWASHVKEFQKIISKSEPLNLGRQPENLPRVVALQGIAGFAMCSLRAIHRLTRNDKLGAGSLDFRDEAAKIGYSFLSLFNLPEATYLIRGLDKTGPYWLSVLEYCANGNLQSVLDEYIHNLRDSLGLMDDSDEEIARQLGEEVRIPLTMRTSSMRVDALHVGSGVIELDGSVSMRGKFALRYGDQAGDGDKQIARAKQVQSAFNSPFWPFVLATTSIGQEGLDFHTYCHAVVHWNLPSNPVDLEQREGRVHRYKGHAVRKNVAMEFRKAPGQEVCDIWEKIFEHAKKNRQPGANDISPYWVFPIPDGARIERHVPALPLSRDARQYDLLRRSLVIYRMVFGQSRQEDLLNFLQNKISDSEKEKIAEMIKIDLRPKYNRSQIIVKMNI